MPGRGQANRTCRAPVATLALIAALALIAGCGGSGHSADQPGARTLPLTSIFESDLQLEADPVGTLALLRRLGVTRVRVFVPWGQLGSRPALAPDPLSRRRPSFDAANPAAYSARGWALYDPIVRAAAARGIGLDFTLAPPAPVWATATGEPPGPAGVWKPSAADFGGFVRAIATRYDGRYPDPERPGKPLPRVSFWAIWNEPNFGQDLAPQATDHGRVEVSPMLYRRLVDAAFSALQATGHGHDTILIGETAPRGQTLGDHPGDFDGMVPLRFLRALYCVGSSYRPLRGAAATERGCPATASGSARFAAQHPALFHAGGFADHPYPQALPPTVATPYEPDFADFAVIGRLESTLDRLQHAYGSSYRFPIYSTEFGYFTDPPETLTKAPPPATAAAYLNETEYLSWRDPRILSYDQYLLADPTGGNFPTGLQFADGRPKATYFAYRMPLYLPVTAARAGQLIELWGCVRPYRYARAGAPRPQIQFRPASGGRFKTIATVPQTDAYGYFDVRQSFPSSGSVRIRWSYPRGPAIFSRTVQIVVR